MQYQVICSNIGTALFTNSLAEAAECFGDFVHSSRMNYGRAAGEDVVLLEDGEPLREFFGSLNVDNNDNNEAQEVK